MENYLCLMDFILMSNGCLFTVLIKSNSIEEDDEDLSKRNLNG